MQTGKSTVFDIFDGSKIFNIPIYQRAYSWEKEQLDDFLNDLLNQYENKKYFFGSFLFHENGKRDVFNLIDIVDGQQRLTTFILLTRPLIKELISKESKSISSISERIFIKDGDNYKLELSNEDSSFLHNYIFEDVNDNLIKINTNSQKLLLNAKKYFIKRLEEMDLESLEKIFKTATEAEVLLYVVDEISSATQIFELLNDRGKKLTNLESIKSFLMYTIGLISKSPNQLIKNIQLNFGEIYRIIEKYNIDEKDLLKYHTIAFEGSEDDPKNYIKSKILMLIQECSVKTSKYRISEYNSNTSDVTNQIEGKINENEDKNHENSATISIIEYSKNLKISFELFAEINEEKNTNYELGLFYMIDRVNPYYPVLMKQKQVDRSKFNDLIEKLNKFNFRAALIGLRSYGEIKFYKAIKENQDLIGIPKSLIDNNEWYINNRAVTNLSNKNFDIEISKNIVKFILVSYENNLRKAKGFPLLSLKEYITYSERERLSIEHITAKKAKNIQFDDVFEKDYLNNIGNLVIDCCGSNSSKGNKNTVDKMDAFNAAPFMSQNEINEIDCDWNNIDSIKKFITFREEKIINFIKNLYDLTDELVEQSQKIKTLKSEDDE